MKQFLALKASAGSGKTFALTIRYISLLLLNIPPKEILTLTFTNKAAAEMLNKIYETLLNLGNNDIIMSKLQEQTALTKEQILYKKDSIVKEFLSSSLSIFTIDKFINKILREFCGYVGINDDFVIEYDDEELLLYRFLISLDEKQFDTLVSFSYSQNKRLSSIIELFKILDEKNEPLNKKDINIDEYTIIQDKILEDGYKIKTFILSCSLSASAKKAVDFNTIDELFQKGKTWLTKDSLSSFTYFKKANIQQQYEDIFIQLKENIAQYFRLKEALTLNSLFDIFNSFKQFRYNFNKMKNSLEFQDITNIVYELLQKHIDKDFLYFRLDSQYTNILIDEFQDTSVLQYKILEPLIDEILAGSTEKFKTFFYVGDTKQSIYRFRGGKKELFDYVANRYDELKIEVLDTNYRSSKYVVEFVNKNFSNLQDYEYYPQKVNSKIEGCVEVIKWDLEEDEPYSQIATKIEQLQLLHININDIAILTYTNADVLNLYIYLKQRFPILQITTEMTSKLIQEQNVQAVINMIKYLYFKEDIYKANFNVLVGQEYETLFDTSFDIVNISLPSLIKQIANKFDILDQNVIKLIELSSGYHNIVDFVYDIDKLDSNRVFKDKQGIQILTIFKSKGLEFETVFVLDRIKRKNHDKTALLFHYENIKLKNIFHKSATREYFDDEYKKALEEEHQLTFDDELNILYVALTRAKDNMIVFKKEKNSVFDVLSETCDYQKIGDFYIPNEQTTPLAITSASYSPLSLGEQDITTQLENDEDTNIKARYFGIATHYCLEMMSDFTVKALDISIVITKNKYSFILSVEDFDDIYQRILLLINNEEFLEIIKGGKIFKEQSLIYDEKINIIDLLIQKDEHFIICDYKTTTASKDEHISQVNFYKQVVHKLTNSNHISVYLIYLNKSTNIVNISN